MDFEAQLIEAARKKLLRELEREASSGAVINNYGGGLPVSLRDQMSQGGSGPLGKVAPEGSEDEDYYVAIRRQANQKGGWDKLVKRTKVPKGEGRQTLEEIFSEFGDGAWNPEFAEARRKKRSKPDNTDLEDLFK